MTRIIVEQGVRVPMRDGVELAADVYRAADAPPCPVLLQRTPYGREIGVTTPEWSAFVAAGYAVVVQDTRGRFDSQGAFEPYVHEADDGQDTLAWLAAQPWSDGTAGMIGASYYGQTQWQAATRDCPSLRCIAPQMTSSSFYEGWSYRGGAFALGFLLTWAIEDLAPDTLARLRERAQPPLADALLDARTRIEELFAALPAETRSLLAELAPYYLDWLAHPAYDDYWRATALDERYDRVAIPSLNVGGWYDCFLGGTLANYAGVKAAGATDAARRPRLIVGPWSHADVLGVFPEGTFAPSGSGEAAGLLDAQLRSFDRHVRGLDNGLDREAPVKLYVMGADRWHEDADWPLPDTDFVPYHLHSRGGANSADGDGMLLPAPPGDQPPDRYRHDPASPVPTVGGQTYLPGVLSNVNAGPRDQRPVEARSDVLCYTSEPLAADLAVIGPITLSLWIVSSAPDADFTGKLVDVHPDGRATILTDGILRARYRHSTAAPAPLEPGRPYRLEIDLWATANLFKAGHRIRLEVASSNFPKFDCNRADAVNQVLHDAAHPSHITLPIVRRLSAEGA